jgi:hypothetical protein
MTQQLKEISMRLAFLRVSVGLILSLPLFAGEPPSVIPSKMIGGAGNPIFVSAAAMVTADGTPSSVVPEGWRLRQQRFLAAVSRYKAQSLHEAATSRVPDSNVLCSDGMMAETDVDPLVPRDNRHDSIVNALAIVAGTIKSVTPGLFDGDPASVVELGHLNKIKLDASYSAVRDVIYVRLPYARFLSGGTEYCRESGPGAYVPKTGDQLLVFAYDPPVDMDGTLVYSTSKDVIAQAHDEIAIRVPKSLEFINIQGATISSITTSIRATVAGERHGAGPHAERAQ